MSYDNPKEEDDDGEILGGTGYRRWGRGFLFSKSVQSYDTDTVQTVRLPLREVTRLLAVALNA